MPKWASCRRNRRCAALRRPFSAGRVRKAAGFTLLELIVVLAILGALMALAMPNLQGFYASLTKRADHERLRDEITRLGATAMLDGQGLVVWPAPSADDAAGEVPLDGALAGFIRHELNLPPDWRLELDRPLVVLPNGVCLGALLTLTDAAGRRFEHDLQAPFCRA